MEPEFQMEEHFLVHWLCADHQEHWSFPLRGHVSYGFQSVPQFIGVICGKTLFTYLCLLLSKEAVNLVFYSTLFFLCIAY